MKWTKVTIDTTTQAVDYISSMLDDLGIEGIEIEDNVALTEEEKKVMFVDILPESGPDDGTAKVSFYLEPEQDAKAILGQVRAGLEETAVLVDIGEGVISISETEDKDWINNWKEFFKPFRAAEDIIIKPTWETLKDAGENDLVVEIDPGIAFGTGTHETTRLCIGGLRRHIKKGAHLLDVGCGSGILSIIGIKLGADKALGTDLDPCAITASLENAAVNGITEANFKVLKGNLIDDRAIQEEAGFEAYDIVTANILADVIIPLSAVIGQHMKQGGLFITSGIIIDKKAEVEKALLAAGFEIIEYNEMGDWVSFVVRKP